MPEGPEVRSIYDSIKSQITDLSLLSIKYLVDDRKIPTEVDFDFPLKLTNITCKGKNTFFHFIDPNDVVLHLRCHLKMTGHWSFEPEVKSFVSFNFGIVFPDINLSMKTIYFSDTRKFATLDFIDTNTYNDTLSKIGPDLLTEDVSAETWLAVSQKYKRWQICKFLLEQKAFSGIGNYLKAEILYDTNVTPESTVSELISSNNFDQIRLSAMKIIRESYNNNGLTIQSYSTPDNTVGTFKCKVYGVNQCPLGHVVSKAKFKDSRVTHWCELCQTI